mgnify:CR=1 FL=1
MTLDGDSPVWEPLPLRAEPITYGEYMIDSLYLRQVVIEYEDRLNELKAIDNTTKFVPIIGD